MPVSAIIVCMENYSSKELRGLPEVKADLENIKSMLSNSKITVREILYDVGRTKLLTSLRKYCKSACKDDDLVIFYSGHGIAYRGQDYLIPADAIVEDMEVLPDVL